MHHHFLHALAEAHHSAVHWAAFLPALAAGILSLVGGILLLEAPRMQRKRNRRQSANNDLARPNEESFFTVVRCPKPDIPLHKR